VGARAFSGGGFSGAHSFGCRSGHSFPFLSNLSLSLSVELHDPVTRDMDLDVLEDAAEDLLSAVDRGVRERRFGAAVRLEVSPQLPPHIRQLLLEKLEIEEVDLYESQAPLGSSSLFQLASRNRPELRAAPLVQRMPQAWLEKGILSAPFARRMSACTTLTTRLRPSSICSRSPPKTRVCWRSR
jgi:hypothetical protein